MRFTNRLLNPRWKTSAPDKPPSGKYQKETRLLWDYLQLVIWQTGPSTITWVAFDGLYGAEMFHIQPSIWDKPQFTVDRMRPHHIFRTEHFIDASQKSWHSRYRPVTESNQHLASAALLSVTATASALFKIVVNVELLNSVARVSIEDTKKWFIVSIYRSTCY